MQCQDKREIIDDCLTYKNVFEDYPFHDPNWCVVRHKENNKVFAWIFEKDGHVWINVKCDSCIFRLNSTAVRDGRRAIPLLTA